MVSQPSSSSIGEIPEPNGSTKGKLLCLTICGFRKPGMSEEAYRHHMTKISAPMTKDLMVKYGVVRWTQVSLYPALTYEPASNNDFTHATTCEHGGDAEGRVQIHNTSETRALMGQLYDPQMANVAQFDCFSQAFFRNLEDYKRMKQDPWYKEKLVGDHENFADTKKSM